jgi:hypothetical protein
MFQAVRSKLIGAWRSLHSKGLVTIFFFELLVVTLGVLLAQSIADWADERAAMADVELAHERIQKELSHDLGKAMIWRAALPCLRERMNEFLRLGSDGTLAPGSTVRPRIEPFLPILLNDEQAGRYRMRFGDERADELREMQMNLENAQANIQPIIHLWGRIMLADPALGSVTQSDREHARLAAADILAELRGVEIVLEEFLRRTKAWGIEPSYQRIGLPATSCSQVWRVNAIAIPAGADIGPH